MSAIEIAEQFEKHWGDFPSEVAAYMLAAAQYLREQQAVIEDLEKENTDLRYLIATKLEQQDGISLNSMAHPITNTPEPSYEIDPDKLETIEIDLPSPKPVAWMKSNGEVSVTNGKAFCIPLYTHPHPDNLGLAESIIKQQQIEIEALKIKLAEAIDAEKDRRFE